MNLIDALKSNKPIRRPVSAHLGSRGDGWLCSKYILNRITNGCVIVHGMVPGFNISPADVFATDWEVKEDEIITSRVNLIGMIESKAQIEIERVLNEILERLAKLEQK